MDTSIHNLDHHATDQREPGAALPDAQELLRLVMEHIPQLVFWKDRRSVYLGCNRSFARAAGVDAPAAIVGKRDEDLPWRDQAETYRRHDRRILEIVAPELHVEETQPRADGSTVRLRTRRLPLHDATGQVVGIVGICEEISESRQEATQRQRAAALAKLLQAIALITSEATDIVTVMQSCIEQICTHLDWPVGHVYLRTLTASGGLTSTGVWHIDQPERYEPLRKLTDELPLVPGVGLCGRVLQTAKPEWLAHVVVDPAVPRSQLAYDIGIKTAFAFPVLVGTEIKAILEFLSDQVVEPDETVIQVMIQIGSLLGRVIERSIAEAQLRASEQRLQDILDNCPSSIYVKDVQGRYLLANRQFELWFGFDRNTIRGKTDFDLFPLEIAEDWRANDLRVLAERRSEEAEEDAPQPDGLHSYLSLKFPLIDAFGEPYAVCGITSDITGRKRAEAEQQRLQEEIIQLQASTLRELSTPLIPITDQVMVMPLIGAIDTQRARQMLDAVLHGVQTSRAERVIVDITGVTVVDSQVAATLIDAGRALRLLGAQMILTGIRPEVAQTLIGLGMDTGDIVTYSTLQSGIATALRPRA
ncbi:MAG TPA: PAS domain-containing protein [Herpetosiphonaceae bacterium]